MSFTRPFCSAGVCTRRDRATQLSEKAQHLSDKNLAAYNWQLEFLRPTIDEIVTKYLKMHGSAAPEEEPEEGNFVDSDEEEEAEEMEAGSGGGAGADAKVGGVGINKAGDGGSRGAGPDDGGGARGGGVLLDKEDVLRRTVVVVEVLLSLVVVVEEQVLGVLVEEEHVRVVVVARRFSRR